MPDELKRHLAKQLRLDHGHPDVWCPFGSPDCGERYDSKKHIIVFELWQTNCDACIKAREWARGSYSFDGAKNQFNPWPAIHTFEQSIARPAHCKCGRPDVDSCHATHLKCLCGDPRLGVHFKSQHGKALGST